MGLQPRLSFDQEDMKEEYDFVVNGMRFWYEEDSEFFLNESVTLGKST